MYRKYSRVTRQDSVRGGFNNYRRMRLRSHLMWCVATFFTVDMFSCVFLRRNFNDLLTFFARSCLVHRSPVVTRCHLINASFRNLPAGISTRLVEPQPPNSKINSLGLEAPLPLAAVQKADAEEASVPESGSMTAALGLPKIKPHNPSQTLARQIAVGRRKFHQICW